MESITIAVTDDTAKKWRNTPDKVKNKLEKNFEEQIAFIDSQIHFQKLDIILDEISRQAKENGLAEEILKEILN